ncbi:MAG: hypothetical protein K9M57_02440, partial [Phycisphaerae bacterium]|nr:hypothetical protein [Phycisphaerae bacterium]
MSETEKHGHDCQCSDDHGQRVDVEPLDPANEALAEALRISFVVLKVVMVGVLVLFVYSGMFKVNENEQAMVLRFGKINGSGSKAILESGWHWAWPSPVEEVIKIPSNTELQLNVDDSFWYYQTEKEKVLGSQSQPPAQLTIGKDGYTLTASASNSRLNVSELNNTDVQSLQATDYNLIHTRWAIRYKIQEPRRFIENLWDGTDAGWGRVNDLLRSVLEDSVVLTSANWDIDRIIYEKPMEFTEQVENRMKNRIEKLDIGIVASLNQVENTIPRQVIPSFDAVANAKEEAQKLITDAEAKANEIINESKADSDILLAQAKAYKSKVISEAQADEKYLNSILTQIEEAADKRVPEPGA